MVTVTVDPENVPEMLGARSTNPLAIMFLGAGRKSENPEDPHMDPKMDLEPRVE